MDIQYWVQGQVVTKLVSFWHKKRSLGQGSGVHRHSAAHELILVDHGMLEVEARGKVHRLNEGNCIYIARNVKHRVTPLTSTVNFINIMYRGRLLPEYNRQIFTPSLEAREAMMRLTDIQKRPPQPHTWELAAARLTEYILLTWSELDCAPQEAAESAMRAWNHQHYRSEKTSLLIEYIEKHFVRRVTLKDVAKAAGISEAYVRKLLKDETGLSFSEHLQHARIEYAKEQLQKSSLSISEIAIRCGFPSLPFFFKVFRRRLGLTPLEYARSFGETRE